MKTITNPRAVNRMVSKVDVDASWHVPQNWRMREYQPCDHSTTNPGARSKSRVAKSKALAKARDDAKGKGEIAWGKHTRIPAAVRLRLAMRIRWIAQRWVHAIAESYGRGGYQPCGCREGHRPCGCREKFPGG